MNLSMIHPSIYLEVYAYSDTLYIYPMFNLIAIQPSIYHLSIRLSLYF